MLTSSPDTKTKIMQAALSLVAADGFAGATTARIANKAGLAEGSIYRHFKNKDDLMLSLYRCIKGEVFQAALQGYDKAASPHTRFTHLWQTIFSAYRAMPDSLVFAQRFAETPLMGKEGGKAHNDMACVLTCLRDDGVAAGAFKDITPDLLISLFYAPIITLLRAEITGRQWQQAEIKDACQAAYDSWAVTSGNSAVKL